MLDPNDFFGAQDVAVNHSSVVLPEPVIGIVSDYGIILNVVDTFTPLIADGSTVDATGQLSEVIGESTMNKSILSTRTTSSDFIAVKVEESPVIIPDGPTYRVREIQPSDFSHVADPSNPGLFEQFMVTGYGAVSVVDDPSGLVSWLGTEPTAQTWPAITQTDFNDVQTLVSYLDQYGTQVNGLVPDGATVGAQVDDIYNVDTYLYQGLAVPAAELGLFSTYVQGDTVENILGGLEEAGDVALYSPHHVQVNDSSFAEDIGMRAYSWGASASSGGRVSAVLKLIAIERIT